MKRKQKFFKKEIEEVDAILPFMSLLIIIIPLLLSNLAFYHFRVVETSVPGASSPPSEDQPIPEKVNKEKMVTAQIYIDHDKTKLNILDEANGAVVLKRDAESTLEGAEKILGLLKKIKDKYSKLTTVLVTTKDDVVYGKLVRILEGLKKPLRGLASEDDPEKEFSFKVVMLPALTEMNID